LPAKRRVLRHANNKAMTELDRLLRNWERWCAELTESSPFLPDAELLSLAACQSELACRAKRHHDCCVIIMVGLKGVPAFQAKTTFSMARLAMVEICYASLMSRDAGPGSSAQTTSFMTARRIARLELFLHRLPSWMPGF